MKDLAVVILAAGQGTRMKSTRAKVLHPILGRPMIEYPVSVARELKPEHIVVVVGRDADEVKKSIAAKDARFAIQKEQKGTGHAVMSAMPALKGFAGDVAVFYGDGPCLRASTLKELVSMHRRKRAAMSLLTVELENPFGYGRIIRDAAGRIQGIVEEKDCSELERGLKEANPGLYCYRADFLRDHLKKLRADNRQKEYYLTDLVALAVKGGEKVESSPVDDAREVRGINSRWELAQVEAILMERINRAHCDAGASIESPFTTRIGPLVKIGRDARIESGARILGASVVGEGAVVEAGARIEDSMIGKGARIKAGSVIEGAVVGPAAKIGPMAHLRPGTVIGKDAKLGNFVETKKADIGDNTKISHLSYVGDAKVGKDANLACGFITCNYDGINKFETVIEDGVFVGSDSQMVAPVKVGKGAYIGSGSTICDDVPAGALALTRAPLKVKEGWAKKKMSGKKKKPGKQGSKQGT